MFSAYDPNRHRNGFGSPPVPQCMINYNAGIPVANSPTVYLICSQVVNFTSLTGMGEESEEVERERLD